MIKVKKSHIKQKNIQKMCENRLVNVDKRE